MLSSISFDYFRCKYLARVSNHFLASIFSNSYFFGFFRIQLSEDLFLGTFKFMIKKLQFLGKGVVFFRFWQ